MPSRKATLGVLLGLAIWGASPQANAQSTWATNANGNWGTAANWSPATVPNSVGAQAVLGNVITANRTVTVSGTVTLGALTINDNNNYTVGSGTLRFQTGAGNAVLTVTNSGSPSVNSALALSNTLSIAANGSGTLSLGGAISGSGGIIKNGTGLTTLSGSGANGFSGLTTINAGELRLNKSSGNALATNAVVGDGSGTDILRIAANNQIADGANVTVNSSGQLLNTGTASDTIGSLTLQGGLVNMGSGTLTLSANPAITSLASATTSTIAGRIRLQGEKTISVADGSAATDLEISARIIDQWYTTINKTGLGTLRLSGSNTFQGPVNIAAGTLVVANANALGPSTFNNSISNGAALHLTGGISLSEGSIQLRGVGSDGAGALVSLSGTNTLGGTLTFSSAATVGSASGSTLILTGTLDMPNNATFTGPGNFQVSSQIYGAGTMTKTGTGTLAFTGATQNINGTRLDVNEGTVLLNRPGRILNTTQSPNVGTNGGAPGTAILQLGSSNQIRDDLFVNVYESGTFDLNNLNDGVAGLQLQGGLVKSGTGTMSILNAGGDQIISLASTQSSVIQGILRSDLAQGLNIEVADGAAAKDLDIQSAFIGSVASVTKQGSGVLRYSGTAANTYTGTTIVEAGTLELAKTAGVNAIAGPSVRVDSGATLQLSAANQIANGTGLILNGGTFLTGETTGNSETLGTLTLNANSTIDLGTGVHQIVFANSSAITWGPTLVISNWTGAAGSSGTQGQIFFGVGGLSAGQLADIHFDGYGTGAKLLASGELVPIPEPKQIAAAVALLIAIAGQHLWKNAKSLSRRQKTTEKRCMNLPRTDSEHLLFVYGSLRSGEAAHGLLAGALFVGESRTKTPMEIRTVGNFRALCNPNSPGQGNPVHGEVWVVNDTMLEMLDEYEGAAYQRRATQVILPEGEVGAMAYFAKER